MVEVDVDQLAEARRVVVAHRLRVAEGLEDGVRQQHLGKWVVACGTYGKREAVWCG